MATLKDKKMKRIALKLLIAKLKKDGLTLNENTPHMIRVMAKEIGESPEDVARFMSQILSELIGEALGFAKVSLVCEGRVKGFHEHASESKMHAGHDGH